MYGGFGQLPTCVGFRASVGGKPTPHLHSGDMHRPCPYSHAYFHHLHHCHAYTVIKLYKPSKHLLPQALPPTTLIASMLHYNTKGTQSLLPQAIQTYQATMSSTTKGTEALHTAMLPITKGIQAL